MQRAEKYSKPWKGIPKASVLFIGVPTENIWQAVQMTKPLKSGAWSKDLQFGKRLNFFLFHF
jgi:hypothetical protein